MNTNRLQQLQKNLRKKQISALFVSNFYNILYLTGFKGVSPTEREGYLIVTADKVYFLTDGRYLTEAESHFQGTQLVVGLISTEKRLSDWLLEITSLHKLAEIYFEKSDLKYSEYENLRKKVTLKGADPVVEELRSIKDEEEVELITKACEMTDKCLNDVVKGIKLGITEKEIAWNLEKWTREHGCDLAFEPIVAFGVNSALPHYASKRSELKLRQNTLILIDYGVKYNDYCSDITRMFYYGKPDTELMNVYSRLLDIQKRQYSQLCH